MAGTCTVTITVTKAAAACPSDPVGYVLCTFLGIPLVEGWWNLIK